MPSSASVLSFLFPLLAAAAPLEERQLPGVLSTTLNGPGNFTLNQETHGLQLRSGPIEYQNLFYRYGFQPPALVVAGAAIASAAPTILATTGLIPTPVAEAVGSVLAAVPTAVSGLSEGLGGLTGRMVRRKAQVVGQANSYPVNSYDTAYMIPLYLGPSNLWINIDTGSADMWAFSTLMPANQSKNHNLYDPSSGVLQKNLTWGLTYLDGSYAKGIVYNDTFTMATQKFPNQVVGVALNASSSFVNAAYDGLMGLGFSTINSVRPTRQKTFFDNVKNTLAAPLFTSLLKKGAIGSYTFGYIDPKSYNGSISYVPVNNASGWWQFQASNYRVGTTGSVVSKSFGAVVDTGTTLLALPNDIVTAYWNAVPKATYSNTWGAYIYPCSTKLPTFTLFAPGANMTVPGSYLNYGQVDYAGNCYGGLQSNGGMSVAILGDIFIKSQFIVYDQTQPTYRLGFARQNNVTYT
ncbi:aspartic peptidase domain-containing protein [Phyllosticta citrichinensis]|uniref:Aspartic peptidase domain-containing protein n=1 Tax=Phyllosticta citrichinensis TaxID=1130410 RepID=A0ABR1Y4Y0_9PEZI